MRARISNETQQTAVAAAAKARQTVKPLKAIREWGLHIGSDIYACVVLKKDFNPEIGLQPCRVGHYGLPSGIFKRGII